MQPSRTPLRQRRRRQPGPRASLREPERRSGPSKQRPWHSPQLIESRTERTPPSATRRPRVALAVGPISSARAQRRYPPVAKGDAGGDRVPAPAAVGRDAVRQAPSFSTGCSAALPGRPAACFERKNRLTRQSRLVTISIRLHGGERREDPPPASTGRFGALEGQSVARSSPLGPIQAARVRPPGAAGAYLRTRRWPDTRTWTSGRQAKVPPRADR